MRKNIHKTRWGLIDQREKSQVLQPKIIVEAVNSVTAR